MSAHAAPNSFPHYFEEDTYVARTAPEPTSLFASIGSAFRWLGELSRRRAVLDELGSLSDHELADIGLTRSDLPRVFEPSFAAEHNRARI